MVEGSEESCEEEDFRDDEKNYAVSKAFLYNRGVMALESAFTDNVSSSLVYS